jgi:hypothetical protein
LVPLAQAQRAPIRDLGKTGKLIGSQYKWHSAKMAFGGWFAGALYDHFGFYAPAFAAGAMFNLANLAVIGFLVVRQSGTRACRRSLPLRVRSKKWFATGSSQDKQSP